MAIGITNVTQINPTTAIQTQAVAKPVTPSPKAAPSKPTSTTSSVPKDTVQISGAAQTALQEASETPAQTAAEAQKGDRQAQNLIARHTPTKKIG
jgi:hypothetical protein